MPKLQESIVINRPPDEVWAYVTDMFNAPRMSGSGLIGLRQTSPRPLSVGSSLQGRRLILGFETRNIFHVTEWDPRVPLRRPPRAGPSGRLFRA